MRMATERLAARGHLIKSVVLLSSAERQILACDHRLTFLGRLILPTLPCALENRIGLIGSARLRILLIPIVFAPF